MGSSGLSLDPVRQPGLVSWQNAGEATIPAVKFVHVETDYPKSVQSALSRCPVEVRPHSGGGRSHAQLFRSGHGKGERGGRGRKGGSGGRVIGPFGAEDRPRS